jgi:hypothetical protein
MLYTHGLVSMDVCALVNNICRTQDEDSDKDGRYKEDGTDLEPV